MRDLPEFQKVFCLGKIPRSDTILIPSFSQLAEDRAEKGNMRRII
jgi:hypothetical protein